MKILAIFMTILIFLTSFDFCKEDVLVNSKHEIEHIEKATDQQEKSDVCSPLCQCARCSFSILLPTITNGITSYDLTGSKFVNTLSGTPIQISPSVWQPPKSA